MKRFLALVLCLVLSMSLVTGCGSKTSSSDDGASSEKDASGTTKEEPAKDEPAKEDSAKEEKVTLTFYCNAVVKNDTPDIIAAFNNEYPNINVEYVELPADATKKSQLLSTILQASDASMDVFMIDTTWPESYAAAGWLEPMDDVLTADEKAAYVQEPINACTIDGKLIALPAFMDVGVMLYRKDLLQKYGFEVPTTWEELVEQSKTIMAGESNVAGFVSSYKQYEGLTCCALEFIKGYGGNIIDDSGKIVVNSAETATALQKMYDMIYVDKIADAGINGYATPDAAAIFNAGNAVFFRGWPGNYVQASNPDESKVYENVGLANVPGGPAGNFSTLGGWSIGVSPFSKNIEEAKLFAKFFSGEKANKIRALAGGNLPVIQSVYEDAEVLAARPQFTELKVVAKNAVARPKSAYYAEVSAAIQQGVGGVLTDATSIEEALKTMQTTIEEIANR